MRRIRLIVLCLLAATSLAAAEAPKLDYRVLATSRTSTMEKELNEAGEAGYRFAGAMGGESAFGGKEVIVIMTRITDKPQAGARRYKLLATSKTSTMQKELTEAGNEGYDYRGQTVFESALGGREVGVILERDSSVEARHIEYKLLSTSKTSTMQKELKEAGEAGFEFQGMAVGKTAFGGSEVVSILKRYAE